MISYEDISSELPLNIYTGPLEEQGQIHASKLKCTLENVLFGHIQMNAYAERGVGETYTISLFVKYQLSCPEIKIGTQSYLQPTFHHSRHYQFTINAHIMKPSVL